MIAKEDVNFIALQWKGHVTDGYSIAYNEAYESFTKTINDQNKADQERAELFIAIASVMSTSIIMAAIASTSLRRLGARMALRTIGESNTRQVIGLFAKDPPHPITAFAFGKAVDGAKGLLSDGAKQVMGRLVQHIAAGVSAVHPLSRSLQLTRLVEIHNIEVIKFIDEVKADKNLPIGQREDILADVKRSPFMNPPSESLDEAKLTPRIELGFYMQMVLQSDYLLFHYPMDGHTPPPERRGGIDIMPKATNYPRSQAATAMSGYTTVETDGVGGKVRAKIQEKYKEVYGKEKSFYDTSWVPDWARFSNANHAEMQRAEDTLRDLSAKTRPVRWDEIKVAPIAGR